MPTSTAELKQKLPHLLPISRSQGLQWPPHNAALHAAAHDAMCMAATRHCQGYLIATQCCQHSACTRRKPVRSMPNPAHSSRQSGRNNAMPVLSSRHVLPWTHLRLELSDACVVRKLRSCKPLARPARA
eukprot:1134179-Pelagomonas_calceolata.AAC.4